MRQLPDGSNFAIQEGESLDCWVTKADYENRKQSIGLHVTPHGEWALTHYRNTKAVEYPFAFHEQGIQIPQSKHSVATFTYEQLAAIPSLLVMLREVDPLNAKLIEWAGL